MRPSAMWLVESVKSTSMNAVATLARTGLFVKNRVARLAYRWMRTAAPVPQDTRTASARSSSHNGCATIQMPRGYARWSQVATATWTSMSVSAHLASTTGPVPSRQTIRPCLLIATIASVRMSGQPVQIPTVLTVILGNTSQATSFT